MRKTFIIALFATVLCVISSSCTPTEFEIETILTPVDGIGENIQLKYKDITYTGFATALGGHQITLTVPCGDKIGIPKGYKDIKVFSVEGYSPEKWLYMVYDSGGISLYKADNVTDIPTQFDELLQADKELPSMPKFDLGLDTRYSPLPDISSDKIIEKQVGESQIENNGVIFEKTNGYESMTDKQGFSVILIDEKGNYITVGEVQQNGDYSDICIVKYDKNGNETKRQSYGGSDFEMVSTAKYNPKMGIVITGRSQSKDGDFAAYTANYDNSPFVACIDPETLSVRWVSPIQIADFVYCVTDEAVFVVRNERNSYKIGELNLSVVKLDYEGKKVWQTKPMEQWIYCIAELSDGKIIVVQKFADDRGMGNNGAITCYNKDGEEISNFEADCNGDITPTDDGGFITVSVRDVRTLPQPIYISATWFDTETVVTKYDKDFEVEWRKTYNNIKDAIGVDVVIPQADGSIVVK